MDTKVEVDTMLVEEAMIAAGLPTSRATVEAALRRLIDEQARRRALDEIAGLGWDGDLEAMREGRKPA